MRAPTHAAIALLFCACAQATPGGPESSGLPDAEPDDPDAAVQLPDGSLPGTADADIQSVSTPVINELVADHIGGDSDEYVEIFGAPNTDYSDHSILVLEGDVAADAGTIDVVLAVGTTDANGVFVTGFGANMIENGTISVLLVQGFSGAAGQDLDSDDDGQIDTEPFTSVVDSVAIFDGDLGDPTYAGAPVLAPDFDSGTQRVGGASRIPDGTDTDVAADWRRNDFDGDGLSCCTTAVAAPGEALNTPGATNAMVD